MFVDVLCVCLLTWVCVCVRIHQKILLLFCVSKWSFEEGANFWTVVESSATVNKMFLPLPKPLFVTLLFSFTSCCCVGVLPNKCFFLFFVSTGHYFECIHVTLSYPHFGSVTLVPPVDSVLHIALCWPLVVNKLLSLLMHSYFRIATEVKCYGCHLLFPFRHSLSQFSEEKKKKAAVTHFALIVSLPSRNECQRSVFQECDVIFFHIFDYPSRLILHGRMSVMPPSRWTSHGLSLLNPRALAGSETHFTTWKQGWIHHQTKTNRRLCHFKNMVLTKDGTRVFPLTFSLYVLQWLNMRK